MPKPTKKKFPTALPSDFRPFAGLSAEQRRFGIEAENKHVDEINRLKKKWMENPDDAAIADAFGKKWIKAVQEGGNPQAYRDFRLAREAMELNWAMHKQYKGEINALKSSIEHLEKAKAELEKKYGGKPPKWIWKNVKKLIGDIKKSGGGGWPHTWFTSKKLFEKPKNPQDMQKLIDSLKKELAARQSDFNKKFKAALQ